MSDMVFGLAEINVQVPVRFYENGIQTNGSANLAAQVFGGKIVDLILISVDYIPDDVTVEELEKNIKEYLNIE